MKLKLLTTLLPLSILITACEDKSTQIGCSSDVSQKGLVELINKTAYNVLSEEVNQYKDITSQNKRSALEMFKFNISDTTTTSKDSNSALKTCEATISVSIPSETYLNISDFFRDISSLNLDRYLEDHSLLLNANTFSKRIEYTVQPTDDAKTVFVKTLDTDISEGIGFIASLTLSKPIIEKQKREQLEAQKQREMSQQKEAEALKKQMQEQEVQNKVQQTTQASSPASSEKVSSHQLSSARSEYLTADTELNRVWSTLSQDEKKALLPSQRQWIKSKDAICGKTHQ